MVDDMSHLKMGRILSRYSVDAVSAMAFGVGVTGACRFGLQIVCR
jgi:hypothetical protein